MWQATVVRYPFLAALGNDETARLQTLCGQFIQQKQFVGAGGLVLTDEIVLAISAQACLPVLNLALDLYGGWQGIVVYQGEVVARREVADELGVVHVYDEPLSGEAMPGGPVVLSWEDIQGFETAADAQADAAFPAYNVVIHEFAHKLDMLKGEADGLPPWDARFHGNTPLPDWSTIWRSALDKALDDFTRRVAAAKTEAEEEALPLDPYATENPAEFFAVASEAFFVSPARLQSAYPELYRLFVGFYRQDPLTR